MMRLSPFVLVGTLVLLAVSEVGAQPEKDPAKGIPARYSLRLAAALEISSEVEKSFALAAIALDAAEDGHIEVIKQCIAGTPDPKKTQEILAKSLLKLVGVGKEKDVLELARSIKDKVARDHVLTELAKGTPPHSLAALWQACEIGKLKDVVRLLADSPPLDVLQKDPRGETALMKAAANGHLSIVEYLLFPNGIPSSPTLVKGVEEADTKGETALMKAAENGHTTIVKLIALRTISSDNQRDLKGETALMKAAAKGHIGAVEALLSANDIKVDLKDNKGKSALAHAKENKHETVVEILKDKGATQ